MKRAESISMTCIQSVFWWMDMHTCRNLQFFKKLFLFLCLIFGFWRQKSHAFQLHTFSFAYVCPWSHMCMSVCICVGECVLVLVLVCVCGNPRLFSILDIESKSFTWPRSSPTELAWRGSLFWEPCLCLSYWVPGGSTWILQGAEKLNPGPHAYTESVLTTEQHPSLEFRVFENDDSRTDLSFSHVAQAGLRLAM